MTHSYKYDAASWMVLEYDIDSKNAEICLYILYLQRYITNQLDFEPLFII